MTAERTRRYAALAAGIVLGVGLVVLLGAPVVLGILALLLGFGGWAVMALEAFGGALWPLLRRTVVAAGLVRTSHLLSYLARPTWSKDQAGGAALAGALALLHRRAHDPALASWLEGKLGPQAGPGFAAVVASGLIAASRGDRSTARELLRSADDFDPDFAPAAARQIANEWLVADAAERGDWATVIRRGVDPARSTAYTAFLARAAARIRGEALVGEPSPTDFGLWVSWLLAPGRRTLRPLLDQARAAQRVLYQRKPPPPPPPAEPPRPTIEPGAYEGDPVAYAQALHALWAHEAELSQRLTAARLMELCRAWEAAWPEATRRLEERSLALGAQTRGEAVVAGVRQIVASELAGLARRAELPVAAFAPEVATAASAAGALRSALLAGVEEVSEQLRQRTSGNKRLTASEELRAWTQLRRLYEEAALLGGMELRYLLFPMIHRDACNYAVWLWNDRKEYGISGPIFKWLLGEAEAVGDQEAIELQRKNVGVKK